MECSFRSMRILGAFFMGMLLCGVSPLLAGGDRVWAESFGNKHSAGRAEVRMNEPIRILSVQLEEADLVFTTQRPFGEQETRHFSLLRFPSPNRLVMDIPHARLENGPAVIPIGRNGITRVELMESRSLFYNAVRAVVYLDNPRLLSQANPVFNGNTLRVSTLQAEAPLPPGRVAAVLSNESASSRARQSKHAPTPATGDARPLSPVTPHSPAIVSQYRQPSSAPRPSDLSPPFPASIGPSPTSTVLGTVPAHISVIESVYFRDHRLYLKSTNGTELHVKDRFTLSSPGRLVVDVANAALRDRTLMQPLEGDSPEVRRIRVGQFDDKTVRIVIETSIAERFDAVYPGSDRSLLAITPYENASMARLSANTRAGELESIDLKRNGNSTVLRIMTTTPMVHRFTKRNDRVVIDLLNESSRPTPIGFDARQYPELARMRLEPLVDGEPNSKLVLQLAGPGMRVVPALFDNGKTLELTITRTDDNDGGTALANLAGLGVPVADDSAKGPYAARIVVDAGHGGKDMGANRNGVNEKDLNLTLALMVRDALAAKGFKVYMTRSSDVFLPLPQITSITNRIQPDLFISIHHNASVNPALNGIETYYYTPQSLLLARRVHTREIGAVGARDGGVKRAMFYVIHHTNVPAILCEVGYVSNPGELADLQSFQRRQQTAHAIADGVVDYLKSRISARARAR